MIEPISNPRYTTRMKTAQSIALWCLMMATLLALTAVCQAIGGKQYGLTLVSAVGFAAGYGLHWALVRKGWRV